MVEIHPLNNFPNYAPVLAYWSYNQWYSKRDIPFTALVQSYIERARNTTVPWHGLPLMKKCFP
ncbi:MAG TPA: hypothetical protein PK348_06090 [Spirochaetota bacterium]|nr:hypothetical protein [Spirochaetota bacterium]